MSSSQKELSNTHPEFLEITLHDLLRMTSGIQPLDKDLPYIMRKNPSDWVQPIMQLTIVAPKQFAYKGCDTHLLSAIISRSTGLNAHSFAQENLFNPLGICASEWDKDPQGNSLGSTGLKMTARDLMKVGALYLDCGKWNGRATVSQEWVERSTTSQSQGDPLYGMYGYGWWVSSFHGEDVYMSVGAKGQYLINIPKLKLTVVLTSDPAREQSDSKSILVDRVLPILQEAIHGMVS